jgi:serine phosphatase RsbU (regulator of sigma subunit)
VLVTDGFFECTNSRGQQLGTARLGESIRTHKSLAAEYLIRRLHDEVRTFSHGASQADDLTAVVIKRTAVLS